MNLPPLNNVTTLMPTNMDADQGDDLFREEGPDDEGLDRLMGIAAKMNLQIDEMQRNIQRLIDQIKELKRNPSKRQRPSGITPGHYFTKAEQEAKAKQEAQAEPDGTLRELDFSGFRPQDDRRR